MTRLLANMAAVESLTAAINVVSSFLDTSDEESDDDYILTTMISLSRDNREKVKSYVETTVEAYLPDTFKTFFKMNRTTFEVLCQNLADCEEFAPRTYPGGRLQLGLDKKVLVAIRYLASQETISELADRFGVTVDTVVKVRRQTCKALASLAEKFIKWPSDEEKVHTSQQFNDHGAYLFPGIIGAIDGSHISIEAPSENPNSYFNRKRFHSVIIQGVCSYDLKFTHVFCGWPGRAHDAKVLKNSTLWETGLEKCCFGRYHLIGDAAYPVRRWLMTPFRDLGNLTRQQRYYNTSLSTKRQCVERAFALLKGRFRRLKHICIKSVSEINEVIMAACVLHNMCIIQNDIVDYFQEAANVPNPLPHFIQENEREGFIKRIRICNNLG